MPLFPFQRPVYTAPMLEKKLLTLACAIGILAFGACFLPPIYHNPPAPPPSLRPELSHIRTLHVRVTEASQPGHIDTDRVAKSISEEVKLLTDGYIVVTPASSTADAVLDVTVTQENASAQTVNPASGNTIWLFEINFSSSLTTVYGAVPWKSVDDRVHFAQAISPHHSQDIWKERIIRREAPDALAARVAAQLLEKTR